MNLEILQNSAQLIQRNTKNSLVFMGITMISDGLTLISYPPDLNGASAAFATAYMTEVNNALSLSEVGQAEYLVTETADSMIGVIVVEQALCWSVVFNLKEIGLGVIINSIIPMQLRGLLEAQGGLGSISGEH
jgi:hypothetical protein